MTNSKMLHKCVEDKLSACNTTRKEDKLSASTSS